MHTLVHINGRLISERTSNAVHPWLPWESDSHWLYISKVFLQNSQTPSLLFQSMVYNIDLSAMSRFWHFQRGAQSGLLVLNLGKRLPSWHLLTSSLFQLFSLSLPNLTNKFKKGARKSPGASPCPTYSPHKTVGLLQNLLQTSYFKLHPRQKCDVLLVPCPSVPPNHRLSVHLPPWCI